jgi:hypothetical protein
LTAFTFASNATDQQWPVAMDAAMAYGFDPASVPPRAARALISQIARWEAQMASYKAGLIRVVDDAGVAEETGATSTSTLISGDFGGDRAGASRQVRTARNLAKATLTDKALSAGEISADKAAVMAGAVAELPESLDEHTRLRVEKRLIVDAKIYSLPDLRRRVMRIADLYTTREDADLDENEKLRRQEAAAWQNTEFWMGQAKNGLVRFGGALPTLQAELLKNQVGAICAPRRNQDTDTDLTHSRRMGRAFCHWIEKIPTDGLPVTGGTPATLTINLDYDHLAGIVREAAGTLATGERLSASEVRRLACTAGILPRVLDGKSQVLDQGRSKRLFTSPQRLALADRDHGCTYPDCDRPPAWTEAHHLNHWTRDNGPTQLNNAALLCARHHHYIHSERINGRVKDNHVQFHIHGIWQTNHRWRP